MNVMTYHEYSLEKRGFFERHDYDYQVETSPMDERGVYHKEYVFKDGAIWYERMSPEWVRQTIEVKRAKVDVDIKMFCTEFWDTDNAASRYYYEKF